VRPFGHPPGADAEHFHLSFSRDDAFQIRMPHQQQSASPPRRFDHALESGERFFSVGNSASLLRRDSARAGNIFARIHSTPPTAMMPPITTLLSGARPSGLVVAAQSAFLKIANLYEEVNPIFQKYGFRAPSAGVISRDVSEKLEEQIVLHCSTFTKGAGFDDLARLGQRWEVKICKGRRLTINGSARIDGENYVVVNYSNLSTLRRVWILWAAEDRFFTPRKEHLQLRTVLPEVASANIEVVFDVAQSLQLHSGQADAGRRQAG
jgi:hypothetical protein